MQEVVMDSPENIKIVDSVLFTKAVGSVADVSTDLSLPEGQDISELIEDQNEKEKDAQENKENN
jgi:hypothetical protein